jgi:asparagine synthase (glutamine-hydrolysing)
MSLSIAHRGPDDKGEYHDADVHLGHRRLSIIGVEDGRQPLYNEDGSIVLVANGEIYNYRELRNELKARGHIFRTSSDSEVIIHLYEEKGPGVAADLDGMFAFVLYDRNKRELLAARDRFGQKPLFYGVLNGEFVFASEIKAFQEYPLWERKINYLSLLRYLNYEYVPGPDSIFEGVSKLSPGHYVIFRPGAVERPVEYWCFKPEVTQEKITEDEATGRLVELFRRSVEKRLMSDVELGVFLSGGIDSTAVAAFAVNCSGKKIKTFSISFDDPSFDESEYSAAASAFIGSEHHDKRFTAAELPGTAEKILSGMGEPFADASLLPCYLLSEFTRKEVAVALGGDGGDELFCGYPTFIAERFAAYYNMLPAFMHKNMICPLASALPVNNNNFSFDFKIKQFLKGVRKDVFRRHQVWLGSFAPFEMPDLLEPEIYEKIKFESAFISPSFSSEGDLMNSLSRFYVENYMRGDILVKIDMAGMSAGLEVRSPFLDRDLSEYVSILPGRFKIRGLRTKHIMKKAFRDILPGNIINRPKKGFGIPVAKWFRNELKDIILDKRFAETLQSLGVRKDKVSGLVREHIAGKKDNRKQLWTLFALYVWKNKFAD